MKTCWPRQLLTVFVVCSFSFASLAEETSNQAVAMLNVSGKVQVNGSAVPQAIAIFPGDSVQTKTDSNARIDLLGSNVMIRADSEIKYVGTAVSVEHGTVAVATYKRMGTYVGDTTVSPVSDAFTVFEVSQTDGKVQIIARKGDVSLDDGSGTTTLAEGKQATRDENPPPGKKKKKKGGAVPAAGTSVLDSPYVIGAAVGAAAGVTTWVLVQGDQPVSPKKP
jgi:hypothetical protein